MADWFDDNAPKGDWFSQNDPAQAAPPTQVITSDQPKMSLGEMLFGQPATPKPSGYVGRGDFAAESGAQSAPIVTEQAQDPLAQIAKGVFGEHGIASMIPKSLGDILGMTMLPRPSEFETKDLPASEELGKAWRGEKGLEAQAGAITGSLLQAAPLLHLPFAESPLKPTPRDLALVKSLREATPQIPETPISNTVQPQTGGIENAQQIESAAWPNVDVQLPGGEAARETDGGQVSAPISGEGVQAGGQGETLQTPQEITPSAETPTTVGETTATRQAEPTTKSYHDSLDKSLNEKYGWNVTEGSGPGRKTIVDENGRDIATISSGIQNGKLILGHIEALPDATGQTAKGLGLVDKIFQHASEFSKDNGLEVQTSARTSPISRIKFEKYFREKPSPVSEGGAGIQPLISKDLGLKEPVSQTTIGGQADTGARPVYPEFKERVTPPGVTTKDLNNNLIRVVDIDGKRLTVGVNPKGTISFGSEPGMAVNTLARTNLGAFKTMNRVVPEIRELIQAKLRENPDQEFIFDAPPGKSQLYQRYLDKAGLDVSTSLPFKIPADHPLRDTGSKPVAGFEFGKPAFYADTKYTLHKMGNNVEVSEIRANSPAGGIKFLRDLTQWADDNGFTLGGDARPMRTAEGIRGLSQDKLKKLYKQFGFEEYGNYDRMLRVPKQPDTGAPPVAAPVSESGLEPSAPVSEKGTTGAPTAAAPEPQSITSIKNAQVDTERSARGLPAVVEPARKAFGESWDQASRKIDENPNYPDQLIGELKAKPRALNDVEDAALLHRQVDLQNQYQKAADSLFKAAESGDETARMESDARVNALSDQLLELYDVGKKAGTETGRGLAARRLLASEDFSLANMITQKRAANQGVALTPEQTAEVNTAAKQISARQAALDAYETSPKAEAYRNRLKSLTEQYRAKTAKGDFATRQSSKIPLDKDHEVLKADLERAKEDWLTALQKDRAANRTPSQKFWDRFVGVERAMKLSSDVVLAKLSAAAVVREAGLTPLEEAAGAGIGKVLPGLAKRAPREGGFSLDAELKAKSEMFTSGMKDAWQNLKMKQSDLDTLYSGRKPGPPTEFYDYLGYLHGALKAPIKRAEFARSLTKRMKWAVENGQDLNNVNTMRALSEEAYVDANRSIFMQDNVVASTFTGALRMAEISKKAPNLGPAVARIGRFLVPIVKIPTNIVGEVATGVHGVVTGGSRAAVAYLKGIDSLPPTQADSIMRQLKKGAIGNALILTGYYTADKIGGFYHDQDKRTKQDVQPGRYRVGGVDLPASAGHSTGAMLLNIGATVKRVQDEKIRKSESATKGLGEGIRAAGAGLAHEIPFVPAATGITDALGTKGGFEKYINGMIQSSTTPALSSHIARILDTPGSLPNNILDEPVKRKPTTPLEAVKMGIPGLRQTVPERTGKVSKNKTGGTYGY